MSIQLAELTQAMGSCGPAGEEVFDVGAESSRTGVGVYLITLEAALAASENCVQVTPRGAACAIPVVEQTSPTVKTVRLFDAAGVALDSGFDYLVLRRSPNLNG
jgi:hypothetical protein